jgi:hypothetical protein
MKVKLLIALFAFILYFPGQNVGAQTVVNFDGSGDLFGTVFGFQFDTTGLANDFDATFTSSGGAIPDGGNSNWLDFSGGSTVTWFEGASGTDAMPLVTGQLGLVDPAATLSDFILSDAIGSSATFVENQNYWVFYDGPNDTWTITGTNVPIPSTILLLGGGLVALVGLRRRRS